MANPLEPGPLESGAMKLGEALAGGDTAYNRGALLALQEQGARATVESKVEQAKIDRAKRQAIDATAGSVSSYLAGHNVTNPSVAPMLSNLIIGGHGADIERTQDATLREGGGTGLSAMLEGDGFTPANARLAALKGDPVPSIDIDGDHVVMGKYSAEPVLDLTKVGEAKVAAEHALGDQREASADASHARAGKTRDEQANPGRYRVSHALSGGGKGSTPLADEPGTGVDPTPAEIEDLFLNPAVMKGAFIRKHGVDSFNNAMQNRDVWMRQHKQAAKEGAVHPPAPRDPAARRAGTRYATPKGDMIWTGTGWTH